jgi:hypothetical protein
MAVFDRASLGLFLLSMLACSGGAGVTADIPGVASAPDAGAIPEVDAGHPADADATDANAPVDTGASPPLVPDASIPANCGPVATAAKSPTPGAMYVESFTGRVTQNEVAAFTAYVRTLTPAPDNMGNAWAQHASGSQTKAMGLLYEIAHDAAILDEMLVFCDAVLSERNDLAPAPVGQHVLWTGRIDPAWPNNTATPITTAGEQGDPVGHLAHCARLVLESPSLWSANVGSGDPHGYGATYLERAKRYVKEADFAIDGHILRSLLDVSTQNRQHWAAAVPASGGTAVPWNQQMMFDYGFQNLAVDHAILKDDPVRVARYDALVQATMDWFFTGGGATPKTDAKGNPIYLWGYSPTTGVEDNSHGNLDVAGFYRAFLSGRYAVTPAMLTPFANTFLDVMRRAPNDYAGRVDGTDGGGNSAPTTYVRADYLDLAELRPADYAAMVSNARMTEGGTTGDVDAFSRLAWAKTRRCVLGIQ